MNRSPPTGDCASRRPAAVRPLRRGGALGRQSPRDHRALRPLSSPQQSARPREHARGGRVAAQAGASFLSDRSPGARECGYAPRARAGFEQLQRQRRAADIHAQIAHQPADDAQARQRRGRNLPLARQCFARRHDPSSASSMTAPRSSQHSWQIAVAPIQSPSLSRWASSPESPPSHASPRRLARGSKLSLLRISSYNAFACGELAGGSTTFSCTY